VWRVEAWGERGKVGLGTEWRGTAGRGKVEGKRTGVLSLLVLVVINSGEIVAAE